LAAVAADVNEAIALGVGDCRANLLEFEIRGENLVGLPMKIRATSKDGVTEVKVLMNHVMETGLRKEASGELVPAMFITEVTAKLNDKVVMQAQWGQAVARNPYLAFKVRGGKAGDKVSISWKDSSGDTRTDETTIS
jgi:sulfur-oxidizing protein SoxZ